MDNDPKKAKSYCNARHCIAIADIILYLGFFALLQASGLSSYLAWALSDTFKNPYLAISLYIIIIGLLLNILSFPMDLLSSFNIEHRYGLSRQRFGSWLKDYLKKISMGGIIYFVFILLIYHLLRVSLLWWLYITLVYFAFTVMLAKIFPVIIIPMFYKLSEISDINLKSRIISLADRCGARVLNIYKIGLGEKTKKANAAVCGLGSTKKILLSDTLLQEYSEDEIELTLGHELAHHKYRHFWKLNFFSFILTLLGFIIADSALQKSIGLGYINKAYDIAFFPAIAIIFILYNIVITPLMNYLSRLYEREADREAMVLTKKPAALASLMRKLSAQNLSDPKPNKIVKFFFYDHPPASERIRSSECFKL